MKSLVAIVLATLILTLGLIAQTPTQTPQTPTAPAQRGAGGRGAGGGGPQGTTQQVAIVDRSGKLIAKMGGEAQNLIYDPAISPDGKRVMARARDKQGDVEHVWVYDATTKKRLTSNEGNERHVYWNTKGDKVVFSMQVTGGGQGTVSNLFIRNSDGSGSDFPLIVSEGMHKWSPTWSPDGKWVVYHTNDTTTNARDIGFVDVTTGKTDFLVQTPATEALPRFSPDGKWVAYGSQSTEPNSKWEVWVTTFPKSDTRIKIADGEWPRWSKDEIFYWNANNLMAAKYSVSGKDLKVGAPVKLFAGADVGMGTGNIGGYNFFYDYWDGKFAVVTKP